MAGQFVAKTAAQASTICSSTKYANSGTVCIDIDETVDPKVVTAFAATGNFLTWASASKLDIQKKILTSGKYDTANNRMVMESRGCLGRRFVKKIGVNDTTSGALNYLTLGIRPPEEDEKKGHLFGDEVLANFGKFLSYSSREEDIICRYGGEEFIVILPETTGDGALMYAERLREMLKEEAFFKKHKIRFSGGISTFPYSGKDLEELFKSVDKSLYAAKYAGKDCIIKSTGDKRRFKRFNKSFKIQYQCLADSLNQPQLEEVITQDVSIGGLGFESQEELAIDSLLLIKLDISDNDELVLSGKIMWVKRISKKLFSYGVKFNDIDTEDANKLKKILPEKFQNFSYENYM